MASTTVKPTKRQRQREAAEARAAARRKEQQRRTLARLLTAVVAVTAPLVLAVVAENVSVARLVGLAFAVAASTFCPLLVLGIWWRRLTAVGALAGMAVGGLLSVGAVAVTLLGGTPPGWAGAVVGQPAAVTVPAAFVTMVLVSLATPGRRPRHVAQTMVRLHTPETVQLDRGPYPL